MRAYLEGWGRVSRAPWLIVGLWLSSLLVALPPAMVLQALIAEHLGASLMADAAARGVNHDWWNEFLAGTTGVGQTFGPAIVGFAAVLDNLSGLADARTPGPVIAGIVGIQLAWSLFLAGGVVDRLARDRAAGAHAFFSACGGWFVRFIRLALLVGPVYWWLFAAVHPWLFDGLFPALTRDVTVERTAWLYRAIFYLAFAAAVSAVNLVADYAKIRAVVEDRRSMIGALLAGFRFVRRHPGETTLVYGANVLTWLVVVGAYAAMAPGASAGLAAFVAGQFYVVLRVMVRLQFVASQTAVFQERLAHAGYVARARPVWPDSPAADAIRPSGTA
jgi:hypothetical protein